MERAKCVIFRHASAAFGGDASRPEDDDARVRAASDRVTERDAGVRELPRDGLAAELP